MPSLVFTLLWAEISAVERKSLGGAPVTDRSNYEGVISHVGAFAHHRGHEVGEVGSAAGKDIPRVTIDSATSSIASSQWGHSRV